MPNEQPDTDFLRTLSVLYVEDEDEVRELLSRFLTRRFGKVDVAANGKEGLELFRVGHHDIVITDVRMPVMDGLTMAAEIKAMERETPVIVITAYNEQDYFLRAIDIGVDRYITKPVDPGQLLSAVQGSAKIHLQQREIVQTREAVAEALNQVVAVLARAIESRDPYTDGHQKRVSSLAGAIAEAMGLPPAEVTGIRVGAAIHDIGKIQVPSEFLSMPRRLSEPEFDLIKAHVEAGIEILGDVSFPWPIADMIAQHHERLDGSGYPRGLKGEEISLAARIIAVADVVEAMSSDRPYRPAVGPQSAMDEIRAYRGSRYDPAVVDACLALLEKDPDRFLAH
ncbi:MAG TPA: HD domain-containing phosphohydrolase [Rhodocyclaceae bacterium]|nr:HD domain-containing phosphohydrolase [Rhodocyclaceae bacterium]